MKIDPDRLRYLRKKQKLSLVKLAEKTRRVNPPGITEKTIQRLEATSQQNTAVREHTIESLVKALNIDVGVLTGELPLPESDNMLADNPERVQIGAQIAPKARLAYDLIKRQYGVSATEIINMAPFFFALLAEGSLAQRREKVEEGLERLQQIEFGYGVFGYADTVADMVIGEEYESISKNDLFGEHLQDMIGGSPFDPDEDNPFAHYLRKLADELAKPDIVEVDRDRDDLRFGSPPKFPDYDICSDELDRIANGSPDARRALETGHARFAEIPEEFMAEDASEARAKWLEDKLPGIYKALGEAGDLLADRVAVTSDENRKLVEKVDSQKTNSETEKEGDDQ